jgi:hypothetical protein
VIALAGQVIFTADGTSYDGADIVLAARAWGDWRQLEDEVRQGFACARHARATRRSPARREAEAAADAFRAARGLFAAAETEAWLQRCGLSAESWMRYVRRDLLRRQAAGALAELVSRYPVSQERVDRHVLVEGVCSGHLLRFAEKLAGRAAAHERVRQEALPAGGAAPPAEEPPAAAQGPAPDAGACALLGLSPDDCRQRLEALSRVEESFRRFREQVLTPRAVGQQIVARHADWARVEVCAASFPDEGAAQEAALCVREDGEDLAEVAPRAGAEARAERFYLEEIEPDLRGPFLSARPGDLLGPLRWGGEYRLVRVLAKVLPSEADPELRRRAEQLLLQAALDREVANRVRWQLRW